MPPLVITSDSPLHSSVGCVLGRVIQMSETRVIASAFSLVLQLVKVVEVRVFEQKRQKSSEPAMQD